MKNHDTTEGLQRLLLGLDGEATGCAPNDPVGAVEQYLRKLHQQSAPTDKPDSFVRFLAGVCTQLVEETIELTIEATELREGAPSKIWIDEEEPSDG